MGVDIRDRLMVGAYYSELSDFFENIIALGETSEHHELERPGEVIECYFDYMSPYYDSPEEEWFVGYRIDNNEDYADQTMFNAIRKAAEKFETLTSVKASLKGGAHVY